VPLYCYWHAELVCCEPHVSSLVSSNKYSSFDRRSASWTTRTSLVVSTDLRPRHGLNGSGQLDMSIVRIGHMALLRLMQIQWVYKGAVGGRLIPQQSVDLLKLLTIFQTQPPAEKGGLCPVSAPVGGPEGPGHHKKNWPPLAGLWPGFFLIYRSLCAPLNSLWPLYLLDSGAGTASAITCLATQLCPLSSPLFSTWQQPRQLS